MKEGHLELIATAPEDWDDLRYAAEMTQRQFRALRYRLRPNRVLQDLRDTRRICNPTRRAAPLPEIRRWLLNGWNTENLLRLTSEILLDEANASALQWSFPQAYYSAYAVTFAYFKAAGYTETTHMAVIKKFGAQVEAGDYPECMSFYATGRRSSIECRGVAPAQDETVLSLRTSDPGSVDKHIAQFMAGTRRQSLDDRKSDMKFKTVLGTRKKRLNATDWDKVSETVGVTSLLSLLYRKRIQANYRDIETIAFAGADAAAMHDDLLRVVTALNFVHEAFIASCVGWPAFHTILEDFLNRCHLERLERRSAYVERLCA